MSSLLFRRLGSALADNVMLYVFLLGAAILLFPSAGPFGGRSDTPEAAVDSTYYAFFIIICYSLYYIILERTPLQSSVFKRINGFRVTDLHGDRIGLLRALVRHVARILTMHTFMLGYLTILFTKRGQALHDLISGTMVVDGDLPDDIEILPETNS